MLGLPNKGSQVVDKLGNIPGFKLVNCPAGIQLGTTKKVYQIVLVRLILSWVLLLAHVASIPFFH
jgi:hypothetical protein